MIQVLVAPVTDDLFSAYPVTVPLPLPLQSRNAASPRSRSSFVDEGIRLLQATACSGQWHSGE